MADIDLHRVHNLGMKAAREAADHMAADLGRKFGLSGKWTANTLHFDRPGVTGSLTLSDKELHLTVTLGFLLKAVRSSLERAIVQELDALFEKKAAPAAASKKPPSPKTATGGRKKGA